MTNNVTYSYSQPGGLRKHYLDEHDIEVLLGRLPTRVWSQLRSVHFNDRCLGVRCLGYVNRGHREITICALPANVSLTRFVGWRSGRRSPRRFGAIRGSQWPERAVRRFMLYDVFLHELGHLQVVDPKASNVRRKFASQTKAQEFADYWRDRLWSQPFDHPDPIHNPPSEPELKAVERELRRQAEPGPVLLAPC